jgi:hypothetical protein
MCYTVMSRILNPEDGTNNLQTLRQQRVTPLIPKPTMVQDVEPTTPNYLFT